LRRGALPCRPTFARAVRLRADELRRAQRRDLERGLAAVALA